MSSERFHTAPFFALPFSGVHRAPETSALAAGGRRRARRTGLDPTRVASNEAPSWLAEMLPAEAQHAGDGRGWVHKFPPCRKERDEDGASGSVVR